ncbi:RHS repeat-associated core domain-containing protein [Xanthomonas arboricola]|uniref:RHS repeat-associated core domain-containing protein n=1 Tax=Xanthomonas arboricola TaxID=56448 RepID=UPI000E1EDF50|nr:RHS repeat-associated core domain-containing protein [Xanthomonas arboricola]
MIKSIFFHFFNCLAFFVLICPVANAQTVRYIHTDGLGSVSVVTDKNHNIIERREYEPYGANLGTIIDGVGYTGHVMDEITGFTYMQQRYYDPIIGKFLSIDPVTAYSNPMGAFNRYWYANNNPYRFTDPDGRIIKLAGDVGKVAADLKDLKSQPEGLALYNRLNNSENVHNIEYGSADGPASTTPAGSGAILGLDGQPGAGSGSTIRIDPNQPIFEKGPGGATVEVPGVVKLGHEMGHSDAMDQGVQSSDRGSGTWGTTPASEDQSMRAENAIRAEHNLPVRDSYYREPVTQP